VCVSPAFLTMTSERHIYVWLHLPGEVDATLAGRFTHQRTQAGNVGRFVYGRSYLQRADAAPVDPVALPLSPRDFETTYLGGFFSVLLDAAPDQWGQRVIDRLHGPQDPMGYLLLAGSERTGALSFSATRGPSESVAEVHASLSDLFDAARAVERGDPLSPEIERLLMQGTSAGGARPKATFRADGRLWLAKFSSVKDRDDLPPEPINEAASLTLAREIGIVVPEHRIEWVGNKPVLLVERFDRAALPGQPGAWTRNRYVSARTVLWSNPEVQRYTFSGSYNNLARQMARWSPAVREDRIALYRRIVFNALICNTDDHELNHGFLAVGPNDFRLAPAFDIVPRLPTTRTVELAMRFGEDGAVVTRANLLSECRTFDIEPEQAASLIDDMAQHIRERWRDSLLRWGADAEKVKTLARCYDLACAS
jgi:serine/threonine-protein kinase HipA